MSHIPDVETRGIVPRQHFDDTVPVHLRRVTYSCRLLPDDGDHPVVEVGSGGNDSGWVLFQAREGERDGLGAWSQAFGVTVAAAPSVRVGGSTTTVRYNPEALVLPTLARGLPDTRFVPLGVEDNRPPWASRTPREWTGVLTGDTLEGAQSESFHPDFLALVSETRSGGIGYSTQVVDLDGNNTPISRLGADFHTGFVIEEPKTGPLGPGPILARPLNALGDDGVDSGGSFVLRDGDDRTLLPISWTVGGPITYSDPSKHLIGSTSDGRIMPAAISTGALFHSARAHCGPIEFHDGPMTSTMTRGYLLWNPGAPYAGPVYGQRAGTWQIWVDSPIERTHWGGASSELPPETREHGAGHWERKDDGWYWHDRHTGEISGPHQGRGNWFDTGGAAGAPGAQPAGKAPDGNPRPGAGGAPAGAPPGGVPAPSDGGRGIVRGGARNPLDGWDIPRAPGATGKGGRSPFDGWGIKPTGKSRRNKPRSPWDGFDINPGGGGDGPPKHTNHGRKAPDTLEDRRAQEDWELEKEAADEIERIREAGEKGADPDKVRKAIDKVLKKKAKIERLRKKRRENNDKIRERRKRVADVKRFRQRVDLNGTGEWDAHHGRVGRGFGYRGAKGAADYINGGDGRMNGMGQGSNKGLESPTVYHSPHDIIMGGALDFSAGLDDKDFQFGSTGRIKRGPLTGSGAPNPVSARLVGVGNTNADGGFVTEGAPGSPQKTAGGVMLLPPCGTVNDAINGVLSTVGGSFSGLFFPSDATGVRFGTPQSDGTVVNGFEMAYYDGNGMALSPVNGSGVVAAGGFEISITAEQITVHGSAGTFRVDGDLEVGGKATLEGRLDPTDIEFTTQASYPGGGSTYGVWVRTSDKALIYTNAGTDTVISTGGGSSGVNGASVYDAGTQSINNVTWTAMNWDTEVHDANGWHDTVTNNSRITTSGSGWFHIEGNVKVPTQAAGNQYEIAIYEQGVEIKRATFQDDGSRDTYMTISADRYTALSSRYYEIYVYQASGGAVSVGGAGILNGSFSVTRVS